MSMRDQITTGITNAMSESHRTLGSDLHALGEADQALLVQHILAALSQTPEGTPRPTVAVTPAATPMLVLSPADVVARYAMDALDDAAANAAVGEETMIDEVWAGGDDYREVRELLFGIQAMFGVRVRVFRADGAGWFRVAGAPVQVRAFQRVIEMIRATADAIVQDMEQADRKVFWATLAGLVTEHEDADHLFESNRGPYQDATDHLNENYGPARDLRRTTAATYGEIYDAAAQVAPVRLPINGASQA